MLPERDINAKSAVSVLYEDVNDIDIYVEDVAVGFKKLYSILFERVFDNQYRVYEVIPLGSRQSVINECIRNQNAPRRPCLFVIDGDLYLLAGEAHPSLRGLFVLPRYCIENFLLEESAILRLLDEECAEKSKHEICRELDFQKWKEINKRDLVPLFIEYAIAHQHAPHIQTVGYGVANLISSCSGEVDPEKVRSRLSAVSLAIKECIDEDEYISAKVKILSRMSSSECHLLTYVSAKDYLLPLLFKRIYRMFSSRPVNIIVKQRLARYCDLAQLRMAIHKVYSG